MRRSDPIFEIRRIVPQTVPDKAFMKNPMVAVGRRHSLFRTEQDCEKAGAVQVEGWVFY